MRPGLRIKILRILHGYTQESLSLRTGINRASLSSWENGSYEPSAKAADIISHHFLCSPGYILFGSPGIEYGVWEPILPKAKRYITKYKKDVSFLFSKFCEENEITDYLLYRSENGGLVFLKKANKPFSYLIFLLSEAEILCPDIICGLKGQEISRSKHIPPFLIHDIESTSTESLSRFFRLVENMGMKLDEDGISRTLFETKKLKGLINDEDRRNLSFSAFKHLNLILNEYEEPRNANFLKLNEELSSVDQFLKICFSRILQEIEDKSLFWRGKPDRNIADKTRKALEDQGFKRKE